MPLLQGKVCESIVQGSALDLQALQNLGRLVMCDKAVADSTGDGDAYFFLSTRGERREASLAGGAGW